MTFAAQGLMPVPTAVAMVLGANLGGGLIAVGLTLGADTGARRMVWANLALRGGGALAALAIIALLSPDWSALGASPERQVINLHLLFNLAVAALGLPLVKPSLRAMALVLPDPATPPPALDRQSALDPAALAEPDRALVCASREVLHMGEVVEAMLRPALRLQRDWDDGVAQAILDAESRLDRMHFDTKAYLARLGRTTPGDTDTDSKATDDEIARRSAELVDLAAQFEAAGDAIARVMLGLAKKKQTEGLAFSDAGWQELVDFHDRVLANAQAALNVQMTQNPDAARALVAEKERVRDLEQALQRAHLDRLRQDNAASFATSNIHQELLRALKQINTAFTMVAYPILTESGDLLASRLSGRT
jgi:phosphate:Na+ symporter